MFVWATQFPSPKYSAICPSTDSVHLPARFRFVDTAHYYSTLFHELVHSTGHHSRLNRDFGKLFGDEIYNEEEPIAETGAAVLCAIHRTNRHGTHRMEYSLSHTALDRCASKTPS